MKYLSVCSGIEAATVAWHHMGWEPVAFSEIEKFPSAVLAHHYPNVPNWGDMTKFQEWPDANVDVLVGGTPCQSFSVAGLRKGLDDPRGNLMLTFGAIAQRYRPQWLVWENVPGVLSSNGGRDFGTFLGMLGELGYGFAYRVLDAQYFGVPQRRRRVFVCAVRDTRNWQRAAAVLFERHSLSGHSAPSRQARKGTAGGVAQSASASGWPADVAPTLNAHFGSHQGQENQHISGGAGLFVPVAQPISFGAQMSEPQTDVDMVQTLQAKNPMAVAFGGDVARSLTARHDSSPCADRGMDVVATAMQVRRLTPVECERLQGFPDGYTAIPWRNKPADECPDGPRYKALGNSMAVPVMQWIGERINQVEAL